MTDQMRPPEPQPAGGHDAGGARWTGPTVAQAPDPAGHTALWAPGAHLLNLVAPVIGPLIVRIVRRDDPFVCRHATEACNFGVTWTLYLLGLVGAMFASTAVGVVPLLGALGPAAVFGAAAAGMVIGFVVLAVLMLAFLAGLGAFVLLPCLGAAAAGSGRAYRYPLTFRFLR